MIKPIIVQEWGFVEVENKLFIELRVPGNRLRFNLGAIKILQEPYYDTDDQVTCLIYSNTSRDSYLLDMKLFRGSFGKRIYIYPEGPNSQFYQFFYRLFHQGLLLGKPVFKLSDPTYGKHLVKFTKDKTYIDYIYPKER